MQVASLELCRELYELSGWNTHVYHLKNRSVGSTSASPFDHPRGNAICPAYNLGFLVRKLPPLIGRARFPCISYPINMWVAGYTSDIDNWHHLKQFDYLETADTPEDAACKLSIELFKQGILVKEVSNNE